MLAAETLTTTFIIRLFTASGSWDLKLANTVALVHAGFH